MKKYINFALAILSIVVLAGCSKDDPFPGEWSETGKLLTRGMTVELKNEEVLVRADASLPEVGDFTVDFLKEGETEPAATYKYAELPEIITLPVGKYKAVAYYGENPSAAWNAPYYKGESETFEIKVDEITDNVAPVVCRLSNVKVTILFDESLRNAMAADASVNVRVGDQGSLDFTIDDVNAGKTGYFAFVDDSHTLAATFNGKVEGYDTHETKTYDNVAPGNHYRITFKLHTADYTDPGYIKGDIQVDATVEVVDMNYSADIDDVILEDDMRPSQGGTEPDPGPGPEPGTGPTVTAEAPIDLAKVNVVDASTNCVLNVHSDTGVTGFVVYIDSPKLTKDILSEFSLDTTLDMVNPASAEMEEGLRSLPLPVKEQVAGQKDIKFDITPFMGILGSLGAAEHTFRLEVTDAGGKSTTVLKLRTL